MSYEHCEKHDLDAANGCPKCFEEDPAYQDERRVRASREMFELLQRMVAESDKMAPFQDQEGSRLLDEASALIVRIKGKAATR